jgi:hypothetical protein
MRHMDLSRYVRFRDRPAGRLGLALFTVNELAHSLRCDNSDEQDQRWFR